MVRSLITTNHHPPKVRPSEDTPKCVNLIVSGHMPDIGKLQKIAEGLNLDIVTDDSEGTERGSYFAHSGRGSDEGPFPVSDYPKSKNLLLCKCASNEIDHHTYFQETPIKNNGETISTWWLKPNADYSAK